MNRSPKEIMELFSFNGKYSYNDKVKIAEYKIYRRFEDFSDVMSNCAFDLSDPDKSVPNFLTQDVHYLDSIARLGVANLADIMDYSRIRMEENEGDLIRKFSDEHYSDIKEVLDFYVKKSVLARVRIESDDTFYAYSMTSTGIRLMNTRFGRVFRDSDEFRTMSDSNVRDVVGRMAVAKTASFIKQQNLDYEILQNKFSRVIKGDKVRRERFPCVMYSPKLHSEIMIQHLYFRSNPQIENEVDRWEYIRDVVRKVMEWVNSIGEIGKNKEMSSRDVVLVCNDYNDYREFIDCLCNEYATSGFFERIGHVYATSVGMLEDNVLNPNEKFYHRQTAEEESGVMKLYDDEFNFIFPRNNDDGKEIEF